MLRMLIADDHPFIREGLKLILQEEYPSAHFDEAEDTHSLVNKACTGEWDIILSDLSMPGGGGLHALQEFSKHSINIPVLIVSMFSEEQYGPQLRKAGAVGFVNKDAVNEKLVRAVQQVLAGQHFFSDQAPGS